MDRELLERIAKQTISSELYYDLCDNIDAMTDVELCELIECNGNYKQELKLGDK